MQVIYIYNQALTFVLHKDSLATARAQAKRAKDK